MPPDHRVLADLVVPGAFEIESGAALALSANLPAPLAMLGVMGELYDFTDASSVAPRDGGLLLAVSHTARSWLVFSEMTAVPAFLWDH